jgi:CRISPR-associated protein Cas6
LHFFFLQNKDFQEDTMPFIDFAFPLRGDAIPIDHGYALFSALNRIVPELHANPALAVHPVRGISRGDGCFALAKNSFVTLRLNADDIKMILPLAGKTLDIQGHQMIMGVPRIYTLVPAVNLHCRVVTIKGFLQESDFAEALHRQLENLEISPRETHIGPRRSLTVQKTRVLGYAVRLDGLTAEESLRIQEAGLGGRRRFGCGVFVRRRED